jgi:uncharacterized protein (DUF4415 family)
MEKRKPGNPRPNNQKPMPLKIDKDLLEFLSQNRPINRFINNLIRDKKNAESLPK